LNNTLEPVLTVNFKLDTTVTINKKISEDFVVLFAEIGGLTYFLFMVITPLIALLVVNRYHFSLFSSLFWVNGSTVETAKNGTEIENDSI